MAPGPEVQLAQLAAGPAWPSALGVSSRCEDPSSREHPRGAPTAHTACVLPSRWLWRSVHGGRRATKQTALYKRRIFYVSSKTDV